MSGPDDIVRDWGADSLRLYEMFMGPLTASKPWQTAGIQGVYRFLKRTWRLIIDEDGKLSSKIGGTQAPDQALTRQLHKTIKKVTEDIEALSFNTGISAMMEFVNGAYKEDQVPRATAEALVLLLAPYAPHIAEELWQRFGHQDSVAYAPWPDFDPALVTDDTIVISVQVNGKLRGTLDAALTAGKDELLTAARALEAVQRQMDGKQVVKEIYVPGKIINFVVK